MKVRAWWVGVCLFAQVGMLRGDELLLNPSFEAQPLLYPNMAENWGVFTQSGVAFQGGVTTSHAHQGSKSYGLLNTTYVGAFEGLVAINPAWAQNQFLAVTPGDALSFGGWAVDNYFSPVGAVGYGQLQIEFYDSQFQSASLFDHWAHSAPINSSSLQPWDWTYFSTGNVAVPEGAAYAKFTFIHTPGSGTGSYFIDELQAQITPVPEPSTTALGCLAGVLTLLAVRRCRPMPRG